MGPKSIFFYFSNLLQVFMITIYDEFVGFCTLEGAHWGD